MVAGLNLLVSVVRFTYPADDSQGGAMPSGTVAYSRVPARIQAEMPTMALVEQGVETVTIFTGLLHPGTLVIEHNDEILVTHPMISPHYNHRFRVIGMYHTSVYADDPRGFVMLTLRRIEESHAIQ